MSIEPSLENGEDRRQDRILVDVTISTPIDAVWRTMRDREQIGRWFGWGAPGAEAEIEAIFFESAEADARRHTIRFVGTDDRFELTSSEGNTTVRVVRSEELGGDRADIYDEMTEGWILFVQQLRLALENHPGEQRSIFRLTGAYFPHHEPELISQLARNGSNDTVVIDTPLGEQVAHAYYRSKYQLGLMAPFRGNGLIVISEAPAQGSTPASGSVTVTAYGLSEQQFDQQRAAWERFWSGRMTAQIANCAET